jgi:hypothetical protein
MKLRIRITYFGPDGQVLDSRVLNPASWRYWSPDAALGALAFMREYGYPGAPDGWARCELSPNLEDVPPGYTPFQVPPDAAPCPAADQPPPPPAEGASHPGGEDPPG